MGARSGKPNFSARLLAKALELKQGAKTPGFVAFGQFGDTLNLLCHGATLTGWNAELAAASCNQKRTSVSQHKDRHNGFIGGSVEDIFGNVSDFALLN